MNLDNEFDELARHKLEERAFQFDEGHWRQAEDLISQRRRRGLWRWGLIPVAFMLMGIVAWMMRPDTTQVIKGTTLAEVATVNDRGTSAATHERQQAGGNDRNTGTGNPVANASPQAIASQAANKSTSTTKPVSSGTMTGKPVHTDGTTRTAQLQEPPSASLAPHTANATRPRITEASDERHTTTTSITVADTRNKEGVSDEHPGAFKSGIVPQADITNDVVGTNKEDGPSMDAVAVTDPVATPTATPLPEAPHDLGSLPTLAVDTLTMHGVRDPITGPSDTTVAEIPALVPSALVPHNAPWEIGILVGGYNSQSRYSGGMSNDWSDSVEPMWSPCFGAELMHVGRNFGIGTGLHYGTYAERITANAIDRSTWSTNNYWFLSPVDTTILQINGTVQQNGQTYFVGEPVNTTVLVLTQGIDSTLNTIRTREARTMTNRVSYLEVPLLLDGHVLQGRWSLGLRGGPTLGLLMGRQGELPNETNDGYVALPNVPFREAVFGYTALAYIRYRWNAAWSVGVEPGIRGQLTNSLGEGYPERSTSAWGGVISVNYRLR